MKFRMLRDSNPRRLLSFALLPLLAATMVVLRWRARVPMAPDPSSRVAPVSASRTNLALVSGRLCLTGQDRSFNGLMLEHSADGLLRSRSAVTNGLLHGLSEGWHTNGQLQVTEYFKAGVSHGLRTKWHLNGVKLSEGDIVDGKFHGTFRRWYDTGFLADQVEFAEGQPHGVSLAWYPSGSLKSRVKMHQGKVLEQNFWPDGEKDLVASGSGSRAGIRQ